MSPVKKQAAAAKDTSNVRHTHATDRIMKQVKEKEAAKSAHEASKSRDLERSGETRQLPAAKAVGAAASRHLGGPSTMLH